MYVAITRIHGASATRDNEGCYDIYIYVYIFFSHTFAFQLLDKPWLQVLSLLPPGSCLQFIIAHRVQQSHCSFDFHRVLLTHALALSVSHFVHKKKSQRIYTSMHSAGLELTKLTYTRLEDNLIRHRGDPEIKDVVTFLSPAIQK